MLSREVTQLSTFRGIVLLAFLGKIKGTEIKKRFVCNVCQSKYGEELKKELGTS